MLYITGDITTKKIKVNGKILSPEHSLKVINHSPDGFNWGYEGSGPAQLALALLLLRTDESEAVRLHQSFKTEHVTKFRKDKNFTYIYSVEKWLKKNGAKVTKNDADLIEPTIDDMVGRKCGDFCTKATIKTCNCSCFGKNHGTLAKTVSAEPVTETVQSFPKPGKH
jgi:hypothetical protein